MPDREWKNGYDVTLAFGSVSPFVTDWEFRETTTTFETSNNIDKAYDFGVGLSRFDIRATIVIDEQDVRNPAFKTLGTCSFSDGIQTWSGSLRIPNKTRSGNASQGSYTLQVEGTFSGTVVQS